MSSHGPSLGKAVGPARKTRESASTRSNSAGASLGRGMVAGLLGGLASGLFLLVVGEPSIDQAIRLEHAASAGHASEEVFTRGEQHLGMVLASGLFGLAVGGVLGILLYVLGRRMAGTPWERSMKIALAGFGAFFLVPFLKYPANPPGVGDPATVGIRTAGYLFLVLVSVAGCFLCLAVSRRLQARGTPAHNRHLTVAATYLLLVGTAFVALPPAVKPDGIPSGLLWEFRMASIGGQAVLWTCTGVILGLLSMRSQRRTAAAGESRPVTEQEV
ncbi:MAG TPA: CbtA family protein [Actinomycetota bacterium]|nr:CbtA family protein [Actinomycetota bacterium]